jgi:hypothetical protein
MPLLPIMLCIRHDCNPLIYAVDASLYWKRTEGSAKEARKWMQQFGPWWDRKGGSDHIMVSTCDDGRGWYSQPELYNVTFITHYGSVAGEEIQLLHTCDTTKRWGAECDWAMTIGMKALTNNFHGPNHIPGRDIVVPSPGFENRPDKSPYINPEHRHDLNNKQSILFYAGTPHAL